MMEGSLSDQGMLNASGDNGDDQDGGEDNGGAGASLEESTRVESPLPWEGGLIVEMEREVTEAGAGGWYNRSDREIEESWSGPNSNVLASQDRVGTTLLTTIGSQTLPNPVRVPNNMMQPAVLRLLMEGPVRPWQCLVWSEHSPPPYMRDLPPLHMSGPSHVLLQIGPYYEDMDGEYWGGGAVEEREGNKGGSTSIE